MLRSCGPVRPNATEGIFHRLQVIAQKTWESPQPETYDEFARIARAIGHAPGSGQAATAPTASGCGQGSWVAGTVDLCGGELVYRDYVYDDHGASLAALPDQRAEGFYGGIRPYHDGWGNTSPAGFADLFGLRPESRDNTADLVALRLRTSKTQLTVTAELNTMFDADRATVVVGIDTDDDPTTAASGAWPEELVASPSFYLPPSSDDGSYEAQLLLHGMGENHSSLMWDPGSNRNPPPIAEKFGAPNHRIIASPLGRGQRGWWS